VRKHRSCANCGHGAYEHYTGGMFTVDDYSVYCRGVDGFSCGCHTYRERESRAQSLFMDSFRKGRAIRDEWLKRLAVKTTAISDILMRTGDER